MNSLIIQRDFDPEVAKEIGTDSAILLENFVFWIGTNRANNKHFHDGRYWTYNSAESLAILFPYLTSSNIEYILKKLKEAGYIIIGNYNKTSYDRTNWYSLSDDYLKNRGIDSLNLGNGVSKIEEPIPDDKPNDNTDKENLETNPLDEYKASKARGAARKGRRLNSYSAPQYTKPQPEYKKKGGVFDATGVK